MDPGERLDIEADYTKSTFDVYTAQFCVTSTGLQD